MTKPLLKRSLLNSLGVVIYVLIVASFMRYAERSIGEPDTWLAPFGFLLLFCVSAAVVGSLVFGYPIILFLNGQKQAGVTAAITTIGWLALETVIVLSLIAFA